MYDFVVATPIYSGVDGITCLCMDRAYRAKINNFQWLIGCGGKGDALIGRARSAMATAFMECGQSDYMIFLDSDIVFDPGQFNQLYLDMKEGYDLIGGCYPVRSGTQISSYWHNGTAPTGDYGIYPIHFLSTGFMGISKYLLQKLVKEFRYPDGKEMPLLHPNAPDFRSYPFFESRWGYMEHADNDGSNYFWLSEDWDFCEKCRAVGVEPHIDTRIQLGHQGNRVVTMQDVSIYQEIKEMHEKEEKMKEGGTMVPDSNEPAPTDFVGSSVEGAKC